MSEPLTRCPMRANTSAIALMPAPATPTMCTRRGVVRSRRSGTGVLLDQISEARRGVGPAELARRGPHRSQPFGFAQQLRDDGVEPGRAQIGVAHHDRRTGPFERLRVAGLVIARRAR